MLKGLALSLTTPTMLETPTKMTLLRQCFWRMWYRFRIVCRNWPKMSGLRLSISSMMMTSFRSLQAVTRCSKSLKVSIAQSIGV